MRKLISLLLALTMVFSLAIAASAATESIPANFNKFYTIEGGESPAETFTYKFTAKGATDGDGKAIDVSEMPALADVTTAFEALTASKTNNVEVTINTAEFPGVGVYVYEMKEVDNNTAGVTYDTDPVYLVITIVREGDSATSDSKYYVAHVHYTESLTGDKIGNIENKYDAGSLKITKEITGNMADMDKEFTFTVTLTPTTGDSFKDNQNVTTDTTATKVTSEAGVVTYTFTLTDGENIVIDNIPTGTTYTVSENEENYEQTVTGNESGTITSDEVQVDYVNNLDTTVDTGITLDSMPFVLMLVICAGAAVLVATKRRSVEF